jgi:hypothetical protein
VNSYGFNSPRTGNLRIYDTTDSSRYKEVTMTLRLMFLYYSPLSRYQEYYNVGWKEGGTYKVIDLCSFYIHSSYGSRSNLNAITPDVSGKFYTGGYLTSDRLVVYTSNPHNSDVEAYFSLIKPSSETGTYGTNYMANYYFTFHITVGVGTYKYFIMP